MKVKELIKLLEKQDKENEVVVRFCLSENDEIGYVLEPFHVGKHFYFTAIYSDYNITKEQCEFIGQKDLKTLWEKGNKEYVYEKSE